MTGYFVHGTSVADITGDVEKIDSAATDGLLGTHNSLAYRVAEIERHFHSNEGWAGVAAAPNGEIHAMDPIGPGIAAFQLDAGNNNWGSWVIIVGSADTPFFNATNKYYDMHRIMVVSTERTNLYFLQYAFGNDTAAAAYAAGNFTTVPFIPTSNQVDGPVDIQMRRQAAGTKMWARAFCPGQNTATISFYPGGHEYEG